MARRASQDSILMKSNLNIVVKENETGRFIMNNLFMPEKPLLLGKDCYDSTGPGKIT